MSASGTYVERVPQWLTARVFDGLSNEVAGECAATQEVCLAWEQIGKFALHRLGRCRRMPV